MLETFDIPYTIWDGSIMISTWMLFAFGAMFGWGFGQGFTKKFINDVSGTKFCLYFTISASIVYMTWWAINGTPNPFYTEAGQFESGFVFFAILAYVLDGIAWSAYFICIKYAPIAIVGTVAAAYPAIVMAVLFYWIGQDTSPMMWGGGIAVILGCILLGYTPKSAMGDVDNSHVVPRIWIPLAIIGAVGWGLAFSCVGYIFSPLYALTAAGEYKMALDPETGEMARVILKQFRFEGAKGADVYPLMAIGDTIILLPFALIVGRGKDTHDWSGIKLAIIPMFFFSLGNICYPMASSADDGTHGGLIAAISAAYPMVTLGFAYIFLKERIIPFHWFAISVVIGGIMTCTGAVQTVIDLMRGY